MPIESWEQAGDAGPAGPTGPAGPAGPMGSLVISGGTPSPISGGTSGALLYDDAGNLAEDAANLWYDKANARVHHGPRPASAGTAVVNAYGGSVSSPASGLIPGSLTYLALSDVIGSFGGVAASNTAVQAGLYLRAVRARGTCNSPATVATGDVLMTLAADAWDGTSRVGDKAQIRFEVIGTVATGRVPTRIVFGTAANAAGSAYTDRMVLDEGGNLVPVASNAYDLGLSSKTWHDLWLGSVLRIAGSQVVTSRQAAVADAAAIGTYVGSDTVDKAALITTLTDLRAQLNALLARMRNGTGHGLITA